VRLEEFDGVARWILDEDLAAARSLDDLATEPRSLSGETLNRRVEIGDDDLEPIPPSRLRNSTSFARATYARLVEQQSQVILRQTGESRGQGKVDVKAEAIAVEVERLVDVCDEVPHSRMGHVRSLRFVLDEQRQCRQTELSAALRDKQQWSGVLAAVPRRRVTRVYGRCPARTGDLHGVNVALYQLS
jgi:hypothetical protein